MQCSEAHHLRLVKSLKKPKPTSVILCEFGRSSSSNDVRPDMPLRTPLVTPTFASFSFLQRAEESFLRHVSSLRAVCVQK